MEEKESKVRYMPDPINVDDIIGQFMVDIAEEQDHIIMQKIQHIGGKRYEHITIDKNKTLDALSKATAQKPAIEKTNQYTAYRCPVCSKWFATVVFRTPKKPHYCYDCGQKLDWSEVK